VTPASRTAIQMGVALLLLLAPGCRCGERGKGRTSDNPPVVVVDPDEVNRPKPVDEVEPNDDRKHAQELTEEHDVEGRLADGKDEDWYRVVVRDEGQVLTATLSGVSGGDLALEALDPQGKRLVRVNNNREGGGETLVNLAVSPGDCFLRVRPVKGRAGQGTYRLGLQVRAREEGEELEPNWKAELATSLAVDDEATGYLGWHTDTDWYRVALGEVDRSGRLRVEFDGVDGVRAAVSLRSGDGAVLQERWGGPGDPVVLSNLAVPAGAEVFVVVRCRYEANVESRYSLRVLAVSPAGPTESEPNDAPGQATVLPADGRSTVAAQLPDSGDRDLYIVRTARSQVVRVEAVPPLGLDLALAVVDAKGKTLWQVDQGKAHQPEVLPALWVQPPGVTLLVRAPHRRETTAVASYHIKAQPLAGTDWEHEPNDTPTQAAAWGVEQPTVRGYVHPSGDVDYYLVNVAGGGLALHARPAPELVLRLDLLLPQGGMVTSAASSAPGAEVRLENQGGGEYVLKVSQAKADPNGSGDGSYTITRARPTETP